MDVIKATNSINWWIYTYAKLRQVANGFDYKVRSFDKYDINGYRFCTYGKELSMADQKSTNCCVSAIGEGDTVYYGRVEAIYEL